MPRQDSKGRKPHDQPRVLASPNPSKLKHGICRVLILWTLGDSNSLPPACKAGALPDEPRARCVIKLSSGVY